MKTHHLYNLILTSIFVCLCMPLSSQMTDKVLLTDYHLNPEKKGDLIFELDNTFFFKNNEFDGFFIKGYSLPGLWIQPKFTYQPLSNLKIEVGGHAIIYRGAYKYPSFAYNDIALWKGTQYQRGAHIVPFARAQVSFKNLNVVLANTYGVLNHGLI